MTNDERDERVKALKAKLKAREGQRGYAQNVAEIKAEIERLENIDGE